MINKAKILIATVFLIGGCTLVGIGGHGRSPHLPVNNSEYAKTAVMITSFDGRSGGTGVILDSNPAVSHVLTNKHVCELVQVGGKVVTDDRTIYPVDSYQVYSKHDLCLIEVHADLKINIKVADHAPADYDTDIVAGHPALLPTIITVGHFSKQELIDLMIGLKDCDGTEKEDEVFACMVLGGKPIVKQFPAQATSSLIMPGSSGSAVFNDKGELSGLIFAGNAGLSYGFMVPWTYIHDFLKHKWQYPPESPDADRKKRNFFTSYFKLEGICDSKNIKPLPTFCGSIQNLGIYHK